jgi:DNA-binding CsgD family transcriptional regulator
LALIASNSAASMAPESSISLALAISAAGGAAVEVLGHLAEFLATDEIATTMFVSVNTVRTHIRNIFRKLGVNRRNEAVRRARRAGLLVRSA